MIDKQLIKNVAKKIDDLIDWKKITGKKLIGAALEAIDNFGLPWGLAYLNEHYSDKIPEELKDNLTKAFEAFIIDDYEEILNIIPEGIDDFVDIKIFDDDFEASWIAINFQAVVKLIRYIALKQV